MEDIENPQKIDPGPSLGYLLEPLGKYLGHMFLKDWILVALGRVLGVHKPIWLQFHVLRTYRRAAGEKRKAKVNAKARALHF